MSEQTFIKKVAEEVKLLTGIGFTAEMISVRFDWLANKVSEGTSLEEAFELARDREDSTCVPKMTEEKQ